MSQTRRVWLFPPAWCWLRRVVGWWLRHNVNPVWCRSNFLNCRCYEVHSHQGICHAWTHRCSWRLRCGCSRRQRCRCQGLGWGVGLLRGLCRFALALQRHHDWSPGCCEGRVRSWSRNPRTGWVCVVVSGEEWGVRSEESRVERVFFLFFFYQAAHTLHCT